MCHAPASAGVGVAGVQGACVDDGRVGVALIDTACVARARGLRCAAVRELVVKSRWLLVVGAVAALTAWGLSRLESPEIPRDALAAAPLGASVVLRADIGAVTNSHAWRALLDQGREAQDVRAIERACGYDPLEQVDEAVVFVEGSREHPFDSVGVLARGEMARGAANRKRLVECVRAVAGGRGALEQVEVEGEPAIASTSGASHAAFLGRDGVVAGEREMVARAIRVARGQLRPAADDETLRRLWSRVGERRDIVAVAHLPERWVPALQRMASDLEGETSALAAVRALALGADVRSGVSITLAAQTASEDSALALEQALNARREALLAQPLVRVSTLGRILRRVETQASGREVVLRGSMTDAEFDALLALWRTLRARAPGEAGRGATPSANADGETSVDTGTDTREH